MEFASSFILDIPGGTKHSASKINKQARESKVKMLAIRKYWLN